MQTCGNCGAEVDAGARFCPACGNALFRVCASCGEEVPPAARFCPACGTPADGETPERASARADERKVVTVVFADVRGSTELGEALDPESLRDVLDVYFSAMREEIEAQGGTVEKFIGDAIVAVFGVPRAHEDDPARALRAASRMLSRLEGVNEELRRAHGITLQIRVGVNTGEVLASPDADPGEPIVTGDVVNTAARLQTAAEPGTVLAAGRTARAARGFRFGDPMTFQLRGKRRAVIARTLLGDADVADRAGSEVGAPMVGRDRELALLATVLDRVADEGRPHLVTIYGEPGVGKSRLTREFLGVAAERADGPAILRGRCLPYGSGVAYWPLAEILKARAGIRDTDPLDVVLTRLDAVCARRPEPADATRARASFAATLGLEDPRRPTLGRDPKQVRSDLHETWRWFLSSLAAERPVIAVIEDIHWADDAVLDLLEELAARVDGPVVFLCPSRPELTERRPTWGGGQRQASSIALDPLPTAEAQTLVHLLLDVDDVPPSLQARILERAEGNPFFLEEIVRHLIDVGAIERVDGRWRAGGALGDVDIPDTVQGVLAARIDLLLPSDKRVLQLAAVVGRVFWPGSIGAQLNGEGDVTLDDALERLQERDLVLARMGTTIAGQREFIFKHVLTRDVAYETMPRRDRAAAHATIATWIQGIAGDRIGEFAELLAHHHLEAYEAERGSAADAARVEGLRRLAFSALLRAGNEARGRGALSQAFALLGKAAAIAASPVETVQVLEARGHAALNDYRGDDAWAAFRGAVDLRLEHIPGDRAAIAYACARAIESPMRWPGSMRTWPDDDVVARYLEIGKVHAGDEPSETLVRLLTAEAFQPFGSMTRRRPADRAVHDHAVHAGLQAAELAMSIGRPDLASAALDGAASAPIDLGLYGETRDTIARRLALVEEIDDEWELGDIYAMAAWTNMMLGDPRTALRWAREGAALLEEEGAEGVAIHSISWAAFAEFQLGEWDATLEREATCARILRDRAEAPPYFTAHAFCAAAMIHRVREELAEYERLRPALETLLGGFSTHSFQGAARGWVASLAIREGRFDDAEGLLATAREARTDTPRPFIEAVTADLLAAAERFDEVPAYLHETRTYASAAGLLALPCHLDRLEGRWAAAMDDTGRAVATLERAAEGLDALGHRWDGARCSLDLTEVLAGTDRRDDARRRLDAVIPVFAELGARAEIERCDALARRLT